MARKLVEFDDVAAAAQKLKDAENAQRSSLSETSLARGALPPFQRISNSGQRNTPSMKSW